MTLIRVILVAILVISPLVSSAKAVAAPKFTGTEGAACHVLSGPNKGKSGTYDDEGACCGSFGCTECKNSDGTSNGKCADGPRTGRTHELLEDILADQVRLFKDQQLILKNLGQITVRLDNLEIKLGDVQTACAPPDLVPVDLTGSIPPSFCQFDSNGNFFVRVMNQGLAAAAASTLRVTFTTPSGPVPVDLPTPALAGGGGFVDLALAIPPACFLPANPFPSPCNFQIAVDVAHVVVEGDEQNNNALGVCVPIL